MSTPPVCAKCGSTNFVGARFCQNCGSPLPPPVQAATAPPASPPTAPPTPPTAIPQPGLGATPYLYGPTSYASYTEQKRRESIDRTKTGLLLLIVGTIIRAIPIIGLLGGIIALVGAILVIIGRNPFGKSHSDYVLWSVGLYIAGVVLLVTFTIGFALALVQAATSGGTAGLANALSSNYNNFLVGAFISLAVTGVANVLFTYALQKPMGRLVLWTGYVGSLALGVYTLSVVGSQVSSAVQAAFGSGTFNRAPIDALQTQLSNLQLFAIVPAIIYAAAYYMGWSRINRNEIPSPPTPPVAPAT